MTREERPVYTDDELHSFLPAGWEIGGDPAGEWDPGHGVLTLTILDNVDFDWPVRISAGAIAEHGRLGALKRALDDAYRDRLGRHTRGLGLA